MKTLYFLLFVQLYFIVLSSQGQNLIKNGDFEEYTKCPKGLINEAEEKPKVLKYVSSPNQGSFDFIHTCDDEDYPRYRWGEESPQSGEGYTGIAVYCNSIFVEGSEYLQLEIKDSLTKGMIYQFEMYLSLGDKSYIAINQLGVHFSNTKLELKAKKCLVEPDIISYEFYENKAGWKKYTGDYIAKGGEKYIIIGNFYTREYTKNNSTKILDKRNIKDNYVYYFIDNVSLKLNKYLSESIVLNNINFISGSSDLLNKSFKELDKVVSVLIANPLYKVEIYGHTENIGEETENVELSKQRAKSVTNYLIQKGIESERITFFGMGSEKPVDDNNTENGRLKNRRVVFIFKK